MYGGGIMLKLVHLTVKSFQLKLSVLFKLTMNREMSQTDWLMDEVPGVILITIRKYKKQFLRRKEKSSLQNICLTLSEDKSLKHAICRIFIDPPTFTTLSTSFDQSFLLIDKSSQCQWKVCHSFSLILMMMICPGSRERCWPYLSLGICNQRYETIPGLL